MKRNFQAILKLSIAFPLGIFLIFPWFSLISLGNQAEVFWGSQYSIQTGAWRVETIDSNGGSSLSLALDSYERPHITYLRENASGGVSADFRIISFDGSKWQSRLIEELAPSDISTSLRLNKQDLPRVAYFRYWQRDLGYAYYDGTKWIKELVDTEGNVGMSSSLRLDRNGLPRIAYWDDTNERVKYARFNGSEWIISTVFDMTCSIASPRVSLALDSHNRPHISFNDCGERKLKYAYNDGSGWQITTVDPMFNSGLSSAIEIDSQDHPHISYRSGAQAGGLMYAYFNGSDWVITRVDKNFWAGEKSSLSLDSNGRPHIAYTFLPGGPEHQVKVAYFNGHNWLIEIVDDAGSEGEFGEVSLEVDRGGVSHLAYWDAGRDLLKYATRPQYKHNVYLPITIQNSP